MNAGPDHHVWAPFPALSEQEKDGTMSRRSPEHDASTEALLQKTFALNLRAARKSKRMTQAEVAKAIGVSTTVFWCYEGARMWPSIETYVRDSPREVPGFGLRKQGVLSQARLTAV
jgi:DNA-binding XRE family transcriptional regulator